MRGLFLRALTAVFLFLSLTYSGPQMYAGCGNGTTRSETVYYNSCGSGKTQIGWRDVNCNCEVFKGGATEASALFKQVLVTECDYPYTQYAYEFYARCTTSSAWVQVSTYNSCPPGC
ncbi:MAG TPA: hypothetical protein VGF69_02330 [Thermoanaerobaculia bacterium]